MDSNCLKITILRNLNALSQKITAEGFQKAAHGRGKVPLHQKKGGLSMTDMAQANTMHESEGTMVVNRKHKSRIFEMVFSDKKELLALYNAVNGTQYDDPDRLVVNTLENAIYMAMHNDISFIIDSRLSL